MLRVTSLSVKKPLPVKRPGRSAVVCSLSSEICAGTSRRLILGASFSCVLASGCPSPSFSTTLSLTSEEKTIVENAFKECVTTVKAPAVLRVLFHDAGTFDISSMDGGANASVRFELDRPENKGLKRGLSCIEKVYSVVQTTSAGQKLSFADTIALAAAYAVGSTKGPRIEMPIGRADATEADPEGRLPDETAPISELKSNFKQKGFTVKEFVALCGSHTLGNKGFGDPAVFDNEYFKILLNQPWNDPSNEMGKMIGLPSDRVLITDEECLELVHMYAKDKDLFFADFSSALVKLSALGTALR
uniref:L-ascorbate peroxidase n=1 Tax=Tetraselmis sp. GSL018 TaxID=582737 RepID=A0A061S8Z4_9CHLO